MFKNIILTMFYLFYLSYLSRCDKNVPIVITTWRFSNASIKAWNILQSGGNALDALEQGVSVCEVEQCDRTVGYGGSPDESGETTLDALIMNGKTMNVGAVGALRRVKSAISVARRVLENTKHSILVGELATDFALQMGFKEEPLVTPESFSVWKEWKTEGNCQPNFWTNVSPDPKKHCGPYFPMKPENRFNDKDKTEFCSDENNHDTIGMVAIDSFGDIVAGTSTNGAKFKLPGRIGDSPIPGSGAYADNEVGGASATGDGDIMLRFLPSFLAIEEMRRGLSPSEAAEVAIKRISIYYPNFMGAVVAVSKSGQFGAACHGIDVFPYVVQSELHRGLQFVKCLKNDSH